jgi:fused signal recognition particle receptor
MGAADTFRAAAIEQLQEWSRRADCRIVTQKMGSDPASVAFDTLSSAQKHAEEVVLIDTAGRLHNKSGLMQELGKVRSVMSKVIPEAPHEVLLVLDASTGQNALEQARIFGEVTKVTGLILTKLDGTARGGIVVAVSDQLGIPVRYIGVGEKAEHLQPFDRHAFVDALFSDATA